MESEQMVQGLAQWHCQWWLDRQWQRESSSKWMCSVAFCVSNGEFWSVEGTAKRTLSCSSPLERYKCLGGSRVSRCFIFHLKLLLPNFHFLLLWGLYKLWPFWCRISQTRLTREPPKALRTLSCTQLRHAENVSYQKLEQLLWNIYLWSFCCIDPGCQRHVLPFGRRRCEKICGWVWN